MLCLVKYRDGCISVCTIAVRRHHDQVNFIKESVYKRADGSTGLEFMVGEWRHGGENISNQRRRTLGYSFETSRNTPQWHTFPNKNRPPNTSQAVVPTADKVIHMNEPLGAILIQKRHRGDHGSCSGWMRLVWGGESYSRVLSIHPFHSSPHQVSCSWGSAWKLWLENVEVQNHAQWLPGSSCQTYGIEDQLIDHSLGYFP